MNELILSPFFSNLISGLVGAVLGIFGAFGIAFLQNRWSRQESERQRVHEADMFDKQVRHDKDMQRREQNIKKTGHASLREIGGG